MTGSTLTCVTASGRRDERPLVAWLDAERLDEAAREAHAWIKQLRLVPFDGRPMRERFEHRGASLWWFTELYLHKTRQLETAVRTIRALERAREATACTAFELASASHAEREAVLAFGRHHGLPVTGSPESRSRPDDRWSSYRIGLTARLSRLRPGAGSARPARTTVAAFVHTAFWRDTGAGGEERYIGPVLDEVAARTGRSALTCVGVGPHRNFRARRWWDPIVGRPSTAAGIVPVEQLASRRALDSSLALWRQRHALARAVVTGAAIREAAVVRGCDLWAVLEPELAAAARLQWPWSARAMDEAGAALDALSPDVVVTYAEAGGWGRAIVLEARRRGIPSVGLQHGFIYRHWLNYLHEPDELRPLGSDAGFPHPDRTLLYDAWAERHLVEAGHLPAGSLRVTGSPKLDALAARYREVRDGSRDAVRRGLGVASGDRLAVLAAKFSEIGPDLPELFDAVRARPGTRLVVKVHPAETAGPYLELARGAAAISVSPPDADLAALLAAADAVVTRNSTVAVDALVLGVPALVVGLSGNLRPFVEAGVMAGAARGGVGPALESVLYDREACQVMLTRAARFAEAQRMQADGRAAARAADAIIALRR